MIKIVQSAHTFRNSSTNFCLFCSMDCMSFRTPENISFWWPSISTRRFCKLQSLSYITCYGNYMLFTLCWLMLQVINGNQKKVNVCSQVSGCLFFILDLPPLICISPTDLAVLSLVFSGSVLFLLHIWPQTKMFIKLTLFCNDKCQIFWLQYCTSSKSYGIASEHCILFASNQEKKKTVLQ